MDRRQLDLTAQSHARQFAELVRNRPAEWAAVVENPMVPREALGALARDFKRQNFAKFAAALAPLAKLRDDALAAIPPRPLLRPADAADNIRVAAEVAELALRTPEGIVARLAQAREEGDTALLARAVPVLEDRAQYAKPLIGHGGLSNALVDAKMHLANVPEVREREAAAQYAAELSVELDTLAQVAVSEDPAGQLEVYAACGALPHLLPAEPAR